MKDYSNWKEKYDKDQQDRRYYFARFCWVNRNKKTPTSGLTWGEKFEQMEGVSLDEYAEQRIQERNQREKK